MEIKHCDLKLLFEQGKVKAGDKVKKVGSTSGCDHVFVGKETVIFSISDNGVMYGGCPNRHPFAEDWGLELVTYNQKTIMTNIFDYFRNIGIKPEDKLLKEFGLEDPINVPTAEGLKMSAEMDYAKNRQAIIDICQQAKAASDAEKKA